MIDQLLELIIETVGFARQVWRCSCLIKHLSFQGLEGGGWQANDQNVIEKVMLSCQKFISNQHCEVHNETTLNACYECSPVNEVRE